MAPPCETPRSAMPRRSNRAGGNGQSRADVTFHTLWRFGPRWPIRYAQDFAVVSGNLGRAAFAPSIALTTLRCGPGWMRNRGHVTGFIARASNAPIPRSLLIGALRMSATEHRELCEPRGSSMVLGAPGGEIPPCDSPNPAGSALSLQRAVQRRLGRWSCRHQPLRSQIGPVIVLNAGSEC